MVLAILTYQVKSLSEVTMYFLSVTSLFSSVSEGASNRGSLATNVVSSDAENVEGSSHVAGPLSREHTEPAVS